MPNKNGSNDEKCPLCNRYLRPRRVQLKAMMTIAFVGAYISVVMGIWLGIVGLIARIIWGV